MVVVEVVAIVHHLPLVVVDMVVAEVVATVHHLPLVEVDSLESLLENHLQLQVDIVHLLHPMGTGESFDKRLGSQRVFCREGWQTALVPEVWYWQDIVRC